LLVALLPQSYASAGGHGQIAGDKPVGRHEAVLVSYVGKAPHIIFEKWSLLIVCATFDGMTHFEEFHAALHIARNILSDRLSGLVRCGILVRNPVLGDARRVRYELTAKGKSLLPMINELSLWLRHWQG
jgi:DNA-binding HxlR family transcriptional regulator